MQHTRTTSNIFAPPPHRYINAYFKELIDGIFQHAGDVIKFAGDAMQVVWRNRRDTCESLPQLVLRASICCLDLLKRLNNFSPVDGVTLKLHMGVGCGTISEFYVGGHGDKWEYFVAGEPIEQMSDATEEATHGQLVLSAQAYETINSEEVRHCSLRPAHSIPAPLDILCVVCCASHPSGSHSDGAGAI